MKKITLIFLVLTSFSSFAQSWDFTNDAGGWTASNSDLTQNANSVTLTTKGVNNPSFNQVAANVDASAKTIIAVTVKTSANGPSYMRASFPKAASGRVYKAIAITKGTTDFKTYYIDLTNGDWTGTVNDIKVQFKEDNNTTGGGNHNTTGETIEIDKIEFLSEIPKVEIVSFTFDTDAQGWVGNNATTSVNGGVISVTPVVGESGKIINNVNTIDASKYKFVEIRYKNLSADNDQIRFQFRHAGDNFNAYKGKNIAMNVSSADFETLEVDLSATAEWNGNTQDFQVIIRDIDNGNKASAGDLQIDSITFKETSTLSSDREVSFKNLSIYPNPTSNFVNIHSNTKIATIQLFNLIGKKVFETKSLINKKLNVSNFDAGVYLLRVVDENNNTKTQKLIIN